MRHPNEYAATTLPSAASESLVLDLRQRMALRRTLVDQAVQVGLALAGVSAGSYRWRAEPIDARHHRYLVTLEVAAQFHPVRGGRTLRRDEVESWLQEVARQRYQLVIDAVYWRGVNPAMGLLGASPSGQGAGTSPQNLPPPELQVSDEEREALMNAVRLGSELPPVILDKDVC